MRPWRAAPTTCVLALLASSCAPPEPARVVDSAGAAPCTETGAAEIPPAGTRLATSYAENFEVHYEPGYKRLVVHAPWGGRTRSRTYYLVPCGSRPDLPADADVLRIPPGRVATTSTTQLPHFVALDVVDHLAGHNRLDFIYDETLRARAAAGELREVGDGVRLEPETLVDLEPDLVFATTIGNPDLDPLGLLGRIGSPAVVDASFMEASPLGRAEWVKLVAAFFDREAEAERIFADIAAHYEELRQMATAAPTRPRVLVGTPYEGTWHVSGGDGFQARLIADAGGHYLWADDDTRGALSLDFETVYAEGRDADVWLQAYGWTSLDEALDADARMGHFAPFRSGRVYNNDLRLSPGGGNDYWELGSLRPDLILADLVRILHPELLPEHELVFHRRVERAAPPD